MELKLSRSSEKKSAEEVEEIIEEATETRKNIRENRLQRYKEMANKDQEFQDAAIDAIHQLMADRQQHRKERRKLMNLFTELVNALISDEEDEEVEEMEQL